MHGINCKLETLLSCSYFFLFGLDFHAVFGQDGNFAEGSFDLIDALLPLTMVIH